MHNTRISTIDALRGFCLLGIIYAHYVFWHSGGPLPEEVYTQTYDIGSTVAIWVNNILIFGKFFALFSFLFGLSFFLQMDSGMRSGKPFLQRYLRRMFLLLLIAAIHQTFWMGDILIIYVPLGFVLLLLRKLSDKWVGILAVIFIMNVPGKLWEILNFAFFNVDTSNGGFEQSGAAYEQIIRSGSLLKLWAFNWQMYPAKMHMQVFSGRLSQTLGYFLLGMYVGRKGWLHDIIAYKTLLKRFWKTASWWGLALLLVTAGMAIANEVGKLGWEKSPVLGFVFQTLFDGFNFALVIWYITGVSLLMIRSKLKSALMFLAPAGRMALTTYLTQTVMGISLFFAVGFGLYRVTTPGVNFLIATVVFVLQAVLSQWWFRHFLYGPVEWLWRCGTAGKWLPFRRQELA